MGYDEYMISTFDEMGMTYVIDNTIIYEYKVVFADYDGSIISSNTYHSGDTVVVPDDPTRSADNTYTYEFAGWDNEVVVCGGNTVYTATYTPTYIDYTVTFKNYDGTVISSINYHYGDEVAAPTEDPTKPADNTYTYPFAGWDSEVVACNGNKVYTATYTPTYIDYTISFVDYNGDTISSSTYHYGDTVTAPDNPTRSSDNTYSYAFAGWDSEVVNCDGDKTYTATFNPVYIEYTVSFVDYNGDTISSKTYHYGDEIVVPADPTRAADNTYTYEFAGWDSEVVDCDGDKTYTATFNPVYIEYTVSFVDYNGDVILSDTYHYGDAVVMPNNPTRAADETYTYEFAGWDDGVSACYGNKTYTATYTPTYIDYTISFVDYDGSVISSNTYHYGDAVVAPDDPTRAADSTYTYAFAGWDNDVVVCGGNTVYTATYTPTYIEYTITFLNYDDSVIVSSTYHYGDEIQVPADPTKPGDNVYEFIFDGWDNEVVACDGDMVYKATFHMAYIEYTVSFVDYDGSVISSDTYHYGDSIVIPNDPTRSADNTYTYEFAGWDNEVVACDSNKVYTATYTPTYIDYTVSFVDYNGDQISSETYHYGDEIVIPADPTRSADNTYTYAFAGWDSEVVDCDGNKVYTAIYTPTYIDYTITFINYDGSVISYDTYHYGDTVVIPADPEKSADNTYTYEFAGWDSEVVDCAGNKTYTATFNPVYIEYTVSFVDYNGDVISSRTYHYGDEIAVPEDPTRAADNTYTYAFAGWDNNVVDCAGDKTYTATYTPTYIDYTVSFVDYDGRVISSNTYHYDDEIVVPEDPSRAADNTYTYPFAGWDSEVVDCDGNKVYIAVYTPTYIEYTVSFVDYDGSVISSSTYHYGDEIVVPNNPTKPADNTYTYPFAGWDSEVVDCDGNKTYTATYTPTYIEYTITFVNYDGVVISSNTYHYGDTVVVPSTPSRPSDNVYDYVFASWDKEVTTVSGDASYKATYNAVYINYTVIFKDYDGSIISNNTYHYGDAIVVPSNPTRSADNTYTYAFAGWDKEIVACAGNTIYTATYTPTYIDYTVKFVNYDGTVISSNTYHYGDTVVVPSTPSKPSDNVYDYVFAGWDSEVVKCDGNKTYTATFNPVYIEYTVSFVDYNGDVISSKTYHYGDTIVVPNNPTRSADHTYTYAFAGWDNEVVACDGNKTYTATYTPTYIEYTITFLNEDGTTFSTANYHYGDEIVAPAQNPSKPDDAMYTYTFAGWDKELGRCTGDATFVARYTREYSADYLSGQLKEQLLDEIEDIKQIDLSTYAAISDIESRMSGLNAADKAAVQAELNKVIAQYNAFVKVINDEYEESSSIFNALIFGAVLASSSLLSAALLFIRKRFVL